MSDPLHCPPAHQPTGPRGIQDYLQELLGLSTSQMMAEVIRLEAQLGAGVLSGRDEWDVASTNDVAVFQVGSYYRPLTIDGETMPALFTAPSMEDLLSLRASNCLAELDLKDRKLNVFDNGAVVLEAIRKTPQYIPTMAPLIIPAATTVQAKFAIVNSALAPVAGIYGLVLLAVAIPRKA